MDSNLSKSLTVVQCSNHIKQQITLQTYRQSITAVVKQFAQWGTAMNTSRLFSVNGIQCLIDKKPNGTQHVTPAW